MPRLLIEILPPHAKAGVLTFEEFPLTIGRSPECTLKFDPESDRATSWNHAAITHSTEGFVLTDSGSTNGTFVNGSRVTTVILKDADRVELGHGGPQVRIHIEETSHPGESTAKTMVATSDLPTIQLKLIEGGRGRPDVERQFHQELITLGRDPESDISFAEPPHPVVSRHHAEVVLRGGEYQLVDKKATNGTLLNGRRIETAALSDGDKITLGEGGPVLLVALPDHVAAARSITWRRTMPWVAVAIVVVLIGVWMWTDSKQPGMVGAESVISEQQYIEEAVKQFATRLQGSAPETVPLSLVKKIQRYTSRLARQDHDAFLAKLQRAQDLMPVVSQILRENNLPDALAYVAMQESGFDPNARSNVGAAGLWQLMPRTAQELGLIVRSNKDERLDVVKSTQAACAYIKQLLVRYGDIMLAMAAYNHGMGNVNKALAKIEDPTRNRSYWYLVKKDYLPKETDEYVYKIISGWIVATNPSRYGFPAELATQKLDNT